MNRFQSHLRSVHDPYRVLLATWLMLFLGSTTVAQTSTIVRVGSKNFTEQEILGELTAQLIERHTDLTVERRFGLGGTDICHSALVVGELDLYVEYTGTALLNVLGEDVINDSDAAFRAVASIYRDRFDLEWLPPIGLNNTYAIAVRDSQAEANGWTKVSDLADGADKLEAGFTSEFMERPDGYPGLRIAYEIEFGRVVDLDPGLMYKNKWRGDILNRPTIASHLFLNLFVMLTHAAAQGAETRRNLLLVTFDTTRADRLGCYGFQDARTPNIDRLASQGTRFLRAYAQSPQTLPSHASLFTGHYTITHNVRSNGQKLDDSAITLAEILSAEGYQTGAIVATAALLSNFNLDQGFASYDDDFEDPVLVRGFKGFFRLLSWSKINPTTTRRADRVAALARKWLKRAQRQKRPFFLWVHFFDPHSPYLYRKDFSIPGNTSPERDDPEENYINEIAFADHYLGSLLNDLARLGLEKNTLTVFTADHGESLGEHDYCGHRRELYEQIIRIPLILRFPGTIPPGEVIRDPAMSIDVAPTVLTLLDIEYPPDAFAGKDLFALDRSEPRKIFSLAVKLFTKQPIRTALIYGQSKYIKFDDRSRDALFRLDWDPFEKVNLRRDPKRFASFDWEQAIQAWFEKYESLSFNDFRMTEDQRARLRSLGYIQ